jgi:transposase-like protein
LTGAARRLQPRSWLQWRLHLDEMFVKIDGQRYSLWRAVDPVFVEI